MTIIELAIAVIVLVTAVAIVGWLLRRNSVTIPEPIMYVLWAALAIFCLLLLASIAGMGPWAVRWG